MTPEEYIETLEQESRMMAEALTRMAKHLGQVRDHRDKIWREVVELREYIMSRGEE